ncbi:hypothetical protein ZWY2020_019601 [Hordeum vulgare]|nr:hypothetical protein ZWY2020_019601 [Hordeum vulgare]
MERTGAVAIEARAEATTTCGTVSSACDLFNPRRASAFSNPLLLSDHQFLPSSPPAAPLLDRTGDLAATRRRGSGDPIRTFLPRSGSRFPSFLPTSSWAHFSQTQMKRQ